MNAALEALRGESPRIVALRAQVGQLLARQVGARRLPPILILGETGTGKGLLAGAIHRAGPRRDGPFVAVNCAAIPETLLEAELFGYERGAFTDARQAKPGLFQTAHGGTLFLDEIGLLPTGLQSKLLTVLEDRAVRRLGSTRTEPVDVALVAATSVELKRAIGEGRFREDLYHRLAVISLELPPLRVRGGDILQLADYFLARACADYGLPARALTSDARARLVGHRWPGTVRELANALERVALLSVTDEIPAAMLDFLVGSPADATEVSAPRSPGSLDNALRGHLEAALRASGGNIRRTAAALGISRNTLRARMDRYGLRQHVSVVSAPPVTPPPPEASAPTEWERRHLAFLRAQLIASSTVDVARGLEMVAEKVRIFGGRVEESGPTGLVAVFGLEPIDNAPSHAALAALAIHNAAARARTTSSGSVVIGIDGGHHAVRRQGASMNIAMDGKAATWPILEALVAVDRPGAIVVTEAVVPFVMRGFVLERLRDPGRDAWVVLRRETAPVAWTRFVGRSSELAILRQASARAAQGHGQIVSIVGDAGVGKSRLLHEVVGLLHGWRVISCGCASYATTTSYFPLLEALRSFCRVQDTDTAAAVRERVARSLPPGAGDPDGVLPPLLDLLGVLPADDAFRAVEPPLRRQRTHDALRQVFLATSVAQPLCLIVEDLHWIDVETQEVLDRLVNGIANARVLLLVNYRPEYQHPWGNKTYYSQIRLDALSAESAGELLDALLGEDPGLAPLKQLLVDRGNPFVLEETVRTLVETQALEGPRGRYRLIQPVQTIQVPSTVQAILAARLDRLAPEDRRLLQVASVVGKDVPFVLLEAIAELPDEALRRGLESLQSAEFLHETGLYPDLAYTFRHALTHEVTYGTLLPDRRKTLHARIAGAIERFYPERLAEQPELLAHHYTEAGLPVQALPHWQRAGQRAMQRSAYAEAIAHLRRGLAVLATLPEMPAHLHQELDLQVALGAALMATQGYASPDVERTHARAHELCQQVGDTPRLFQALRALSLYYLTRGMAHTASDLGLLLLRHAEAQPDPAPRLVAHHSMGMVLCFRGEPAEARTHHTHAVALHRSQEHQALAGSYGVDVGVLSHCWLAWEQWLLGFPDRAVQEGRLARTLAQEAAQPWCVWMTLFWSAVLHQWRRETTIVSELMAAVMRLGTEQGFTLWSAWGRLVQGWALALQGQGQQGVVTIREGLAAELATGSRSWQAYGLGLLAEAHGHGGHPDEGLAALAEARAVLEATGVRFYAAELHRLQGALLLRRPAADVAQAEECFQRALDVARRQGARSWELRAAVSLGRLWEQQGKRGEALALLSPIYGWFTEGFDTADLQEAKGLLEG